MKFLAIFFLFLGAQAQAIENLPSIKYLALSKTSPQAFPISVDRILSRHGYRKMNLPGLAQSQIPMNFLDRIYFPKEKNLPGYVMTRTNLYISGQVEMGKLYKSGDSYLVHFRTTKFNDIAFYFKKTRESTAFDLAEKIKSSLQEYISLHSEIFNPNVLLLIKFGLTKAEAEEATNYFCSEKPAGADVTAKAMTVFGFAGSCLVDGGRGVWSATGGMIGSGFEILKDVAVGGYHLYSDPSKVFEGIGKSIDSFTNFIRNFGESFGEYKDEIMSLPSEIIGKILCETSGIIGTGALIAYFTAGTGSASVLKPIAKALAKIAAETNSEKLLKLSGRVAAAAFNQSKQIDVVLAAKSQGKNLIQAEAEALKNLEDAQAQFKPWKGGLKTLRAQYLPNFIKKNQDKLRELAETLRTSKLTPEVFDNGFFKTLDRIKDEIEFIGRDIVVSDTDKKFFREHLHELFTYEVDYRHHGELLSDVKGFDKEAAIIAKRLEEIGKARIEPAPFQGWNRKFLDAKGVAELQRIEKLERNVEDATVESARASTAVGNAISTYRKQKSIATVTGIIATCKTVLPNVNSAPEKTPATR